MGGCLTETNKSCAPISSKRAIDSLLTVRNLRTFFFTENGVVRAVDDVTFSMETGETVGIVGESGCGKSVTSLSIMRLIPSPPGKIVGGEIIFEGVDLLKKNDVQMRNIRGNSISIIFQEPMTSLDPVFTIGYQITEAISLHQRKDRAAAKIEAIKLLRMVGIPSPERRIDEYPHQMSGGMRQRVMIAIALACRPRLLIADEPTTALDVTVQAQILTLLKSLRNELRMAIMLITHNLGIVAEIADKIIVMYAGQIVEMGDTLTIFKNSKHPYTLGLLNSIPKLNEDRDRLQIIRGDVPNPFDMPKGCRFHPRCYRTKELCQTKEPQMVENEPGHWVMCHF